MTPNPILTHLRAVPMKLAGEAAGMAIIFSARWCW